LTVSGQPIEIPSGFTLAVAPRAVVHRGDVLADSDFVTLNVSYRNEDDPAVTVIFPPEGIELLHRERGFPGNVAAAFLVFLGRLAFLAAVGLGLATFLDGKVAALVTLFVLVVAAGHGFLEDALGPIVAGPDDRVFGLLDAPTKVLLRGVLFLLPDLGRRDPSEALATGRCVLGVVASLGILGGVVALAALSLGSVFLARREIGSS
jgi:hypothetical protein